MAIELQEPQRTSYPVLRHQRIGELAPLAVIKTEQRDRLRKDPASNALVKIPNGTARDGGPKFRQELVVHCIAMPGITMQVKAGDDFVTPAEGDRVRVILKGKGFGEWIEAKKAHRGGKMLVGDVLLLSTQWAQRYDQDGNTKGEKLTTQADVDRIPRGTTVGMYGPIELSEGTELRWIEAAEAAYMADQQAERERAAIPLEEPAGNAHDDLDLY
jgi:hypothetical protein